MQATSAPAGLGTSCAASPKGWEALQWAPACLTYLLGPGPDPVLGERVVSPPVPQGALPTAGPRAWPLCPALSWAPRSSWTNGSFCFAVWEACWVGGFVQ